MSLRHSTAGIALVPALPVGQAPNQAQMVTQTVAGVKFSTLPGFVIERVNPPDKADSYVALTFDSHGRLVVSKEQDHPRLLLDTDKDGVYEAEKIITDKVRNCQGLWFDGRAMYGSCVHVQKAQEAARGAAAGGRGGGRRGGTARPAFSRWRTRTTTTWRIRWRSWAWRAESRSTVRTLSGAGQMAGWP